MRDEWEVDGLAKQYTNGLVRFLPTPGPGWTGKVKNCPI